MYIYIYLHFFRRIARFAGLGHAFPAPLLTLASLTLAPLLPLSPHPSLSLAPTSLRPLPLFSSMLKRDRAAATSSRRAYNIHLVGLIIFSTKVRAIML